jgi:hypothetical protein
MTPQLTPAQLQHAIENGTKLVEAKKLEISAYQSFKDHAPAALRELIRCDMPNTETRLSLLQDATENLCQAKLSRAEVELEELEMQVKAYKFIQSQQGNRIQLPNFGKA